MASRKETHRQILPENVAGYLLEGDAGTRIILGSGQIGLFNQSVPGTTVKPRAKSRKAKRIPSPLKDLKREAKAEFKNMRHHATKLYEKALESAKEQYQQNSVANREMFQKAKAQAKEEYQKALEQAKTEYEFTVDIAKDHYCKDSPAKCDRDTIYRDTRILTKQDDSTTVCILREDSPEMEEIRKMVEESGVIGV